MFNRKSYLIILIISILSTFVSFGYIGRKSAELNSYWGSDFIAEIYQHPYSLDKFFIQLGFLSLYLIFGSLILLIFNFRRNFIIYSILFLTILLFAFTHISLNIALTDTNLSAIGAYDLGK